MKINYKADRIQSLLRDLYVITRLGVSFWDHDMNPIASYPPEQAPFCEEIRATPEGRARCMASDRQCMADCLACGIATRICHAGIPDTAIPLYFKGVLLGFIMFGQVLYRDDETASFAHILQLLEGLPVDIEKQRVNYANLPRYDKSELRSASAIAKICLRYILLEDMVHIEDELLIDAVTDYIKAHIAEPITQKTLCRQFSVSTSTMYSIVQRHRGCSVHAYVKQLQMQQAADMLVNSTKSISDISIAVGHLDTNYFSRIFRQIYGLSPSEYRERNRDTHPSGA